MLRFFFFFEMCGWVGGLLKRPLRSVQPACAPTSMISESLSLQTSLLQESLVKISPTQRERSTPWNIQSCKNTCSPTWPKETTTYREWIIIHLTGSWQYNIYWRLKKITLTPFIYDFGEVIASTPSLISNLVHDISIDSLGTVNSLVIN